MAYIPERGELIWLDFDPQAGHEQAGWRPALVLSHQKYNQATGRAIVCPVTSKVKGWPFEVVLPAGLKISGAVLADQLKSQDLYARGSRYADRVPDTVLDEIQDLLVTILS